MTEDGAVAGAAAGVAIRELVTADELNALPEFELRIWQGANEVVSGNLLVAVVSEGGVALGAFAGERIVGAVFGFPTRDPAILHSHYMAVDPEFRRQGLAVALKQRQRAWCLDHGYTTMRWTFDPLQLANAHLNLRVLGTEGTSYHVDHYGALGGINGGLPSDRLTVTWDLRSPRGGAASLAMAGERFVDVQRFAPDAIERAADEAIAARLALRDALAPVLADGWRVVDVDRDARRYRVVPPPA